MLAARLSVEELLYRAETAQPGSVVDLMLAPGESLAMYVPGPQRTRKRGELHVAEDEMAIACVPPVGHGLRVLLHEPGHKALWPLDLTLPRDVAVAVLHPAGGGLSLRQGLKLELVITREELAA